MNLAHIHIVLNHVPSLGSVLGLLMLVWALYTKNEALKKASYRYRLKKGYAVFRQKKIVKTPDFHWRNCPTIAQPAFALANA